MNEYFVPGSVPAPNSPGGSATMRAEFSSIATAFDKLPVLAGSANELVIVNATGTALIASGFLFSDFVTLSWVQTLTNKTLAWAGNTWPGFGTGATKVAGTAADNVLLLAENAKLPALDGSLLTNLTPAAIGVVPIVNGGTGASDVAGAQANLGIDLKADANNAVFTGAPTCPTPPVGNTSARLANTQFVTDTITAIGAAIPSDTTPLMNGVAAPGVHTFVSRDDHVHPTDTSRAPIAYPSFIGTLTHSGDVVLSGTGQTLWWNGYFNNGFKSIQNGYSGFLTYNALGEFFFVGSANNTSGPDAAFIPIERLIIDANGSVLVKSPAGLGYGPGAGGTVTQATSKDTSVTLNKPFGVITMHNASLAAGETVQFNLNNSLVGANDIVYAALCGGGVNGGYYRVQAQVYTVAPGIVFIQLTNQSPISLAEAVQIKFILFKGAVS